MARMIADHYTLRPGCCTNARLSYNPKPMFSYEVDGAPPLEARFEKLDALDALVAKLRYYQYFDPEISIEDLMDFEGRSSVGLLVKSPGGLGIHGLVPGDYVVSVGGSPALGPQVLARPLLSLR